MKRKIAYVAGAFRAKDNTHGYNFYEQQQNIERARDVSIEVWRQPGWCALCPHMNTADFQGALPDDVWIEGDLSMMEMCAALVLVPGWEDSEGTKMEIRRAHELGIPVLLNVDELPSMIPEIINIDAVPVEEYYKIAKRFYAGEPVMLIATYYDTSESNIRAIVKYLREKQTSREA